MSALQIVLRTYYADNRTAPVESVYPVALNAAVTVGRVADLGTDVFSHDDGVSRIALTVTVEAHAWVLRMGNRNGAVLQPWAQAPDWLSADSTRTVCWPRVGVRLVGNDHAAEHWVLLEGDRYQVPVPADSPSSPEETLLKPRPRELTANQLAAVYATFESHLSWPPASRPVARSLEAVAHRLGVTPSAVRERLKPVQERARDLGLHEPLGVTEPDYVYHLAAHGYLPDVPPAHE